MYTPTNSANYPATPLPRIDCSEIVMNLQDNPQAFIAALDSAMSRIMPCVLASGCQLNQSHLDEYHQLKTVRDGLLKAQFGLQL